MARTNLPLTDLVQSASYTESATAVDPTNGMNVVVASEVVGAKGDSQDVILIFTNSGAGSETITVRAGSANPPAFRNGLGDLAVACASSAITVVGPFESARFAQPDGSLNVDFSAAATGTVVALRVPRTSV